ncbi:MAG: ABC transporter ATP-binding protein/permease [Magnetococcus sp. WYHC-3]
MKISAASPPSTPDIASSGPSTTRQGPMPGSRVPRWAVLRHIREHFVRHGRDFAIGFALLLFTGIAAAAIPYGLKLATDDLSAGAGPGSMGRHALLLVVLALLSAWLRIRARTHIFAIGREVEYALRRDYHAKLTRLGAAFFDASRTGDLVSRGTGDVLAVRMFIGPGFLQITNALLVYTLTLPIMISLDPALTLLALLPFPLAMGLSRLLTGRLYRLSRDVADRFGDLSGFVQEAVAGSAVIRTHARERDWSARFAAEAHKVYAVNWHHARLQSTFGPLMMLSGALGGWILLAAAGSRVAAGSLTIGDFVAFSGYLAQLIWPTVGLGWILTVIQRGLAALERLNTVLDQPDQVLDAPMAASASVSWRGQLSVRGLTFAFPSRPERMVLQGVDMEIPAGAFVGLVGRVGAGKSALLGCLARLYDSPRGQVFVDGRDLCDIPEAELRGQLAMAPQESFLFSVSVADNILYGKPDAPRELAWTVARLAALDDEIRRFPAGMDTLVGERGITLSGGQRQRMAIARALAMDPRVLLLDDIFSSVDAHTEAAILDGLRQWWSEGGGGRTVVLVCHRVAALHRAERIFVLEAGRVVDQGPHEALLSRSASYRELHQRMEREQALEELA